MIVQELIEELKSYNPNAEVTTPYSETIYLSFIGGDKSDAKIVFVEQRDYVDDRFSD